MPKQMRLLSFAVSALVVASLVLAAIGCSDDDARPADPVAADLTLTQARVSIDGRSLDGQAVLQGDKAASVQYEARLTDHQGNPLAGGQVLVRYGMQGMMGHDMHLGEFPCYDDGTHGDPMPGDGIYCFVDDGQEYGCHRADARPGEYHYEFCGFDQQGHESNRMTVRVSLLP